jgi:predicted nucleic acid-binding protein
MIVLDSNVISEMMKKERARPVVAWLRLQAALQIFTTAISVAEIMAGIMTLPAGRRRDDLAERADRVFGHGLRDRILAFDDTAAGAYARIVARGAGMDGRSRNSTPRSLR